VLAPLALTQLLLPALRRRGGAVLNITSDAAVEAYAGWGGYGAAKAALEQASNVLAAEENVVLVWRVDPGDLRRPGRPAAPAAPSAPQPVVPSAGWTGHIVTPEHPLLAVDGLLTGLHEPRSSRLRMLAAFADLDLLSRCGRDRPGLPLARIR
jgi:NAD(P)-dependent dehydrogenase (short-subunit alcohol dehydrogenase family)